MNEVQAIEANQDESILNQQRQIEKEVAESCPLISGKEPISVLEQEYQDDKVYSNKVKTLEKHYSCLRRTRPDGNCFFRGFGFSFFEQLLDKPEQWAKFRDIAESSKDQLLALGFPKFTVEDFYDNFMDIVNRLGGDSKMSVEELENIFNDAATSDYVVVYLRLITSGQLQKDEEFYKNFLEGDKAMKEFCQQEVEPMYRESDHLHAIALTSALQIGIRIVYMDRGESSPPAHHFPDGCTPAVIMLYRPGHYDILYN